MTEEPVLRRLDELITVGEQVVATRRSPPPHVITGDFVDSAKFRQWRTSSLSLPKLVLGEDSTHYQEYSKHCKNAKHADAVDGLAVLKSAKEEIQGGYLTRVKTLAFAEVFADFLEMADHLIETGYKDSAASLIGAVLENGLRKLAQRNGNNVKSHDDLGVLNQKLADQSVYSRIVQREIHVQKGVRDAADHGQFDQYDDQQVRRMAEFARKFLSTYF